jgi:hypothetical protein
LRRAVDDFGRRDVLRDGDAGDGGFAQVVKITGGERQWLVASG